MLILDPGVASNIDYNASKAKSTFEKASLSELQRAQVIPGPVLKDKHWRLLFVDITEQAITYIDPFGAAENEFD